MLTVGELVEYLKTLDQEASVLAFEPNSNAYIEQFPDLPNQCVCTVAEDKKREEMLAKGWYRGTENAEESVRKHLSEVYRYAKDSDVVFNFS